MDGGIRSCEQMHRDGGSIEDTKNTFLIIQAFFYKMPVLPGELTSNFLVSKMKWLFIKLSM